VRPVTLAFRALPPLIPTCAISLVTSPAYGVPMAPLYRDLITVEILLIASHLWLKQMAALVFEGNWTE
jgi:hypothetical protein